MIGEQTCYQAVAGWLKPPDYLQKFGYSTLLSVDIQNMNMCVMNML